MMSYVRLMRQKARGGVLSGLRTLALLTGLTAVCTSVGSEASAQTTPEMRRVSVGNCWPAGANGFEGRVGEAGEVFNYSNTAEMSISCSVPRHHDNGITYFSLSVLVTKHPYAGAGGYCRAGASDSYGVGWQYGSNVPITAAQGAYSLVQPAFSLFGEGGFWWVNCLFPAAMISNQRSYTLWGVAVKEHL